MSPIKNILFDCERMKYQSTGLFHYCKHLGNALLANCDQDKEKITLYLKKQNAKYFDSSDVLFQDSLHKFVFPNTKEFDIWHCTYQGSQYEPSNKKIKKVLTIHDLNFLHEPGVSESKKKRERKKLQAKIDRYDHFVFISEFVKNDVLGNMDLKNKPTSVIYNGCNFQKVDEIVEPKIKINTPFLFTIGTVNRKKNFHVLLNLLLGTEFYLVIGGVLHEPEYVSFIESLASELGVKERVIFTDQISENDKKWYMKHCTAFVFPSLAEGFGLPVIEAMSYGKAVFLSKATSLPEIGGSFAYYFNSFERSAMVKCLKEGLNDYKIRQPQEQIKQWSDRFNWNNAAKQYLSIYRSLY